jgi:hypothetical protein
VKSCCSVLRLDIPTRAAPVARATEERAVSTIVRRRQRDTNEMPLDIRITRGRSLCFELPEGLPYDHDDGARILVELEAMDPTPDEIETPVASGLGDLVSATFVVTWWDCKLEDYELLLMVQDAVKCGLITRAWRTHENGRVESRPWPRDCAPNE